MIFKNKDPANIKNTAAAASQLLPPRLSPLRLKVRCCYLSAAVLLTFSQNYLEFFDLDFITAVSPYIVKHIRVIRIRPLLLIYHELQLVHDAPLLGHCRYDLFIIVHGFLFIV